MKRLLLFALTALLAMPCAANADIAITNNGDINTGTTWTMGAAPVSGDMNVWETAALTVKTGTQTWEGQELQVQTGGRLATLPAGPTLTMNGALTMDGGTITNLNNGAFVIDLQGNSLNLNSGILDSGLVNNGRDIIFQNAVFAGSGTISVQGGTAAGATRSAVTFQNNTDSTSGFTGLFTVTSAANFFLPNITAANASFGIDVNGSGQLGLTNDTAVTSAVFDGIVIGPGTYTRAELLGLGVNNNRVLSAGATGSLTVVPEPSSLAVLAMGSVALFVRRRK